MMLSNSQDFQVTRSRPIIAPKSVTVRQDSVFKRPERVKVSWEGQPYRVREVNKGSHRTILIPRLIVNSPDRCPALRFLEPKHRTRPKRSRSQPPRSIPLTTKGNLAEAGTLPVPMGQGQPVENTGGGLIDRDCRVGQLSPQVRVVPVPVMQEQGVRFSPHHLDEGQFAFKNLFELWLRHVLR